MKPCEVCDCPTAIYNDKLEAMNEETWLDYLIDHRLVAKDKICESCGNLTKLDNTQKAFRCRKKVSINKQRKKQCEFSQSVFKNTMFGELKLDPKELLKFCSYCVQNEYFTYKVISSKFAWNSHTLNRKLRFCRQVCYNK